jgi:hypothetical protein
MWATVSVLSLLLQLGNTVTITGYIYCDNYFEFYFNGQLIKKDPLTFTPHQAVKVSFEYDGNSSKTYAIMCQDFATDTGYEYTNTDRPQLGDGALLAEFSDGTVTSANWKAYVATFGPTDASVSSGCSSSNLSPCAVQDNGIPDNWYTESFDDSEWSAATEYTTNEAGWGMSPTYSDGMCGKITSPLTRQAEEPSSIETTADECLDPKLVLCGGDETCSDTEGRMLWGADMDRDNKMLFRYTTSGGSDVFIAGAVARTPTSVGLGLAAVMMLGTTVMMMP